MPGPTAIVDISQIGLIHKEMIQMTVSYYQAKCQTTPVNYKVESIQVMLVKTVRPSIL